MDAWATSETTAGRLDSPRILVDTHPDTPVKVYWRRDPRIRYVGRAEENRLFIVACLSVFYVCRFDSACHLDVVVHEMPSLDAAKAYIMLVD